MRIASARKLIVFLITAFLVFFVFPNLALADTTPYRSAGWVSTAGQYPYTNIDKCQRTDNEYCTRSTHSSTGAGLYFGSFGNLEEFGIPYKSTINAINIRLKGMSSSNQIISVNNTYHNISPVPGSSINCDIPSVWKTDTTLGPTDKVIERRTVVSGTSYTSLPACLNAEKIDQESITFIIGGDNWYGTSPWTSSIDNFEISFEYTAPAITYENPSASDFNGTVWQLDKNSGHGVKSTEISNVKSVSKGTSHTLALKSDGTVWAWGNNSGGQLGDGTSGNTIASPIQVKGPGGTGILTDIKAIAAGGAFSMALKNDGKVWIWGANGDGLRGTTTERNNPILLFPTQVRDGTSNNALTGIIAISAGNTHSLALKTDGTVISWGANTNGKVGHCEFVLPWDCGKASNPLPVPDLGNVKAIAAGSFHNLVVKNDGTVWGWGRSGYYELGSNNLTPTWGGTSSVQVSGLSDITAISIYDMYNTALDSDGCVFHWGDSTIRDPVQINNLSDVIAISTGYKSANALKADGTVWQWWMINAKPVKIKNLSGVTALSSGRPSHAIVGTADADTPPAPFLDLPWNYENKGLSFENAVLAINSFFDHEYPVLSIKWKGLYETSIQSNSILEYTGLRSTQDSYSSHDGYDYGKPAKILEGEPVLAAAEGWASFHKDGACGNNIHINHDKYGFITKYCHLSNSGLITTDSIHPIWVDAKQEIGKVGMTGKTTGAHIHFMIVQDKNHSGNFESNLPEGLIDPYGWEPMQNETDKSDDPWEFFRTTIDDIEYTGNKSYYLWKEKLSGLKETATSDGGTFTAGEVSVEVEPNTFTNAVTLEMLYAPINKASESIWSVSPVIEIIAKNLLGDYITLLSKPVKLIWQPFKNVDLSRFKPGTFYLYSSKDANNWTKEIEVNPFNPGEITAAASHFSYFAIMGERRDMIPPTTTAILNGTKGQNNWLRSNVELVLNATDSADKDHAGVEYTTYKLEGDDWETYTKQLIFTDEGHYEISYYSEDFDGNIEEIKSVEFDIDKTAPIIVAVPERGSDSNEWYNHPLKIDFKSNDELDSCDSKLYEGPDSRNTVINGSCTDKAGNIGNTEFNLKYDATKPAFSASAISKGQPFITGSWTNRDVTVTFECDDDMSGVGKVSDSITLSSEVKDQSVKGECVDNAGNKSEIEFEGINIDKTPPVLTIKATPDMIWPPNGKMVDVRISGNSSDDNLEKTTFQVIDEYGKVQPIISGFDQTIQLEAKRNGEDKDGRKYEIKVIANDKAGNANGAEAFVDVSHDQRK